MNKREAFVEQATVEMRHHSDPGAVGAAVTVELCGHWEHAEACQWPHHTSVSENKQDDIVTVRTVFVCAPEEEADVRRRVVAGLTAGELADGPKGPSSWTVVSVSADKLLAKEQALADRLAGH
jgi:hypothetical protein